MISNIIALTIYPLLVITSFAHSYKGDFDTEFYSKRQTTTLKGIMIIVVFFHHLSHALDNIVLIEEAYRIAQFSITTFFLIAGYTTCLGHLRSENIDLKKIWINRSWRLYLPLVILTVWANNFLGGLLFFFIFTDLAFILYKKNSQRLALITFGNFIFIPLCMLLRLGEYWFVDVLTYFVGVAFAMYKNEILAFFSGARYWISLAVLILLSVHFSIMAYFWCIYIISDTISSFCIALVVLLVMMKRNLKSDLFYFIGQYTWEIFLLHQMTFYVTKRFFRHNSVVMILSFVMTICLAVLVQKSVKRLRYRRTVQYSH